MLIVPLFLTAMFIMTMLIITISYLLALHLIYFSRLFPTLSSYLAFILFIKIITQLIRIYLNRPKRPPHDPGEPCPICLATHTNTVLHCNHWFHDKCIDAWAVQKSTCPLCRAMF